MTADERIKELLNKANYHPVRFKNTDESEKMHRDHLLNVIKDKYHGDPLEMVTDLVETINDLECALENVLA